MANNKDQLVKAIKNLEDAFINLNRVWELEGNDQIMVDVYNETREYPFSKSFDELTREVSEWSYLSRKEITGQED